MNASRIRDIASTVIRDEDWALIRHPEDPERVRPCDLRGLAVAVLPTWSDGEALAAAFPGLKAIDLAVEENTDRGFMSAISRLASADRARAFMTAYNGPHRSPEARHEAMRNYYAEFAEGGAR
jgi:hypothetical protein